MSDIAIRVEHLGKQYEIGGQQARYATFRESFSNAASVPLRWLKGERFREKETFWALDDVSFEVKRGEAVGIIGRNGAGKSTLLKILSRITSPTTGRVDLYGRVGSLLEVGTGFHPELTGRENIYLNGAVLGMSRVEITRKFDEIVDFSGVEKFLDTPVKHFSSGMYVRLAFVVAAHLEPEILMVDEVLAVGDAEFQKKCLGKMGEVAREGRTVLFVSHQMDMIRSLCAHGILLNNGKIHVINDVAYVIDSYILMNKSHELRTHFELNKSDALDIQIVRGKIIGNDNRERDVYDLFSKIIFEFEYLITKPIEGSVINFELKRNGSPLFLSFDTDENEILLERRKPGYYVSRIKIPSPLLKAGRYTVSTNTGIINLTTFQHLEDVLSFDIELQSKPSSLLSYADKRNGVIAMPLKWQTQEKTNFPS